MFSQYFHTPCKYLVNNVLILQKIYHKVLAYVDYIKNFSKVGVSKALASKRMTKYNTFLNLLHLGKKSV